MKIKIIPRWEQYMSPEGQEKKLYDVYHGFTRFLFFTKWKLDEAGLGKDELKNYLEPLMFGCSPLLVNKITINL